MSAGTKTHARGGAPWLTRFLPFADAASEGLPMGRLLRLSLFQVSVGMSAALLFGALNRVLIVEIGVASALIAVFAALPLVLAPLRALIGHKSDTHISALGWRRAPYIWFGALMQFGGLAIMPFAFLVETGQGNGPAIIGHIGAGLAFFLVGAGVHVTQTAGLALATDLADDETRPRVVALLYVMLLVGMGLSALVFGWLLADFGPTRLVQVIQGAAIVAMVLNTAALWGQEPRRLGRAKAEAAQASFSEAWATLARGGRAGRLLLATGLGAAAFAMQDILLEPYGGEILGLSVSATTQLTALFAFGALGGFALAARSSTLGYDPHRIAAFGALFGAFAFVIVILSGALAAPILFRVGVTVIGFSGGLFGVGTLIAAMGLVTEGRSGLAVGAWGAAHATATGLGLAAGGLLRDLVGGLADKGALGPALTDASVGYGAVYLVEIAFLFISLAVIGPLARLGREDASRSSSKFGLAEFPG